jgi:hypothetical protein
MTEIKNFTTTLNEIRKHYPPDGGWTKLLKTLGKTKYNDEPISLLTIIDSNGLDYSLWCSRAFQGHDRDFRLFAVWCARQVNHLMHDDRSIKALDVAEQFANGLVDDAAWAAARAAARDAARDAAGYAAWAAAWDAAWAASGAAAGYAAWAAAGAASGAAAGYAAWDAARAAAGDAAWDAAWAAAGAAAGDAAMAAARDAQEKRLRQMIADGGWIGSTSPEAADG